MIWPDFYHVFYYVRSSEAKRRCQKYTRFLIIDNNVFAACNTVFGLVYIKERSYSKSFLHYLEKIKKAVTRQEFIFVIIILLILLMKILDVSIFRPVINRATFLFFCWDNCKNFINVMKYVLESLIGQIFDTKLVSNFGKSLKLKKNIETFENFC